MSKDTTKQGAGNIYQRFIKTLEEKIAKSLLKWESQLIHLPLRPQNLLGQWMIFTNFDFGNSIYPEFMVGKVLRFTKSKDCAYLLACFENEDGEILVGEMLVDTKAIMYPIGERAAERFEELSKEYKTCKERGQFKLLINTNKENVENG